MMTLKQVMNHKPYFTEWLEDINRLFYNDTKALEMSQAIEINCNNLLEATHYLMDEIVNEWDVETATNLLEDLKEFIDIK